jgi:L-threonylcarbamoyladenylate synthase
MARDPAVAALDDPRGADLAWETLRDGGVAVLPTDTLPGLSAALSSDEGVRRISAIKRAPTDRRYIVLASSIDMVDGLVRSYGCASREHLASIWPAPLSVILPSGPACPAWMGPTIAIRVPALAPLRAVIERLGTPIVSTSVNRAGDAPLVDARDIEREMGGEVDLIVTGPPAPGAASTLVDLTRTTPRVVRRGSYAWGAAAGGKPSNE